MSVRTAIGQEMKALWGDGKGLSLASVSVAWGLLIGSRMIYPVMIPYLETAYGLSLTAAGLLVTVLWASGSIGQLPGGILADRVDERILMVVGTVTAAAAIGIVITAPTPIVLFAATAAWGLGYSVYPIARITFLSNIYSDRLGSALGVTLATGDIGQTVLPPIATVLAVAIGWKAGLGFIIPLLVLSGIFMYITLPKQAPPDRQADSQPIRDTINVLGELRNPTMGIVAVVFFLYMFIWQSFTAFYPTYLITVKELSPSVASLLFGFFFAIGVVMKPLAGAAYDRIGVRGSLVGILAPPVAGFVLLPIVDNVWLLVGITALISTMLGSGTISQSYLADSFPQEMQGTGLGAITTVTATLASLGPLVFGVIADYEYFDQGYAALALTMVASILLVLRMSRSDD